MNDLPISDKIDKKLFVVLWSPSDRHFHVETIEELIDTGIDVYMRGKKSTYHPLAFLDTKEECAELIEAMKKKFPHKHF